MVLNKNKILFFGMALSCFSASAMEIEDDRFDCFTDISAAESPAKSGTQLCLQYSKHQFAWVEVNDSATPTSDVDDIFYVSNDITLRVPALLHTVFNYKLDKIAVLKTQALGDALEEKGVALSQEDALEGLMQIVVWLVSRIPPAYRIGRPVVELPPTFGDDVAERVGKFENMFTNSTVQHLVNIELAHDSPVDFAVAAVRLIARTFGFEAVLGRAARQYQKVVSAVGAVDTAKSHDAEREGFLAGLFGGLSMSPAVDYAERGGMCAEVEKYVERMEGDKEKRPLAEYLRELLGQADIDMKKVVNKYICNELHPDGITRLVEMLFEDLDQKDHLKHLANIAEHSRIAWIAHAFLPHAKRIVGKIKAGGKHVTYAARCLKSLYDNAPTLFRSAFCKAEGRLEKKYSLHGDSSPGHIDCLRILAPDVLEGKSRAKRPRFGKRSHSGEGDSDSPEPAFAKPRVASVVVDAGVGEPETLA